MISMITEIFTKGFVLVCSFLLPLQTSFLLIGALVIFDTVLALFANKKNKVDYSDDKFDTFFMKSSVYMLILLITNATSLYFGFDNLIIIKTMTSIIAIKELNSADRKIEILLGFSTFKYLINKLNKFIKK